MVGLKWDAIDFERGTISIKRTVTSTFIDGKHQEFEQQSVKTKSSLRTLPLIGSFREYFTQVKEAQELNKQVCYNYAYDGFVFVDEMGEWMKAGYLTCTFPDFLEKHGLRRMRFHDLRHSCASLLLAGGVPLKHIQERKAKVCSDHLFLEKGIRKKPAIGLITDFFRWQITLTLIECTPFAFWGCIFSAGGAVFFRNAPLGYDCL